MLEIWVESPDEDDVTDIFLHADVLRHLLDGFEGRYQSSSSTFAVLPMLMPMQERRCFRYPLHDEGEGVVEVEVGRD
ncbi:hypothetical protein M407DRAFT_22918 [Tulasnella calospora MUT 4182]|uniref:Uncharacterized protein n=1 Tax=Tulasnella calospora MUT 4182 TaxID=1051891 RepID=A0A0C3QBJ1_9AGAM|nr:hypothetical protein M407DRAFT_22918 [Tulasnella calospora MUT 4182]